MTKSELEMQLAYQIRAKKLPEPETEARFHPTRMWRFDLSWPKQMLAVEIEGGVWIQGRHSRGAGFTKDCEKYNEAVLLGWRVIRVTGAQINSGEAIGWISAALQAKESA